jgi:hypothetical protein
MLFKSPAPPTGEVAETAGYLISVLKKGSRGSLAFFFGFELHDQRAFVSAVSAAIGYR